ncbi:MAG: molybdopterin converting factor subunit 1 [Gammaproteobacteria bacterium]|nr:molybdopterin converting factor subunit 1 [Gammaproteobacteria bacterium]
MTIEVKFFASLRERLGRKEAQLEPAEAATVADVWQRCTQQALPANVMVAVNQEYVQSQHPVQDGDEVAFFPPVTGG